MPFRNTVPCLQTDGPCFPLLLLPIYSMHKYVTLASLSGLKRGVAGLLFAEQALRWGMCMCLLQLFLDWITCHKLPLKRARSVRMHLPKVDATH